MNKLSLYIKHIAVILFFTNIRFINISRKRRRIIVIITRRNLQIIIVDHAHISIQGSRYRQTVIKEKNDRYSDNLEEEFIFKVTTKLSFFLINSGMCDNLTIRNKTMSKCRMSSVLCLCLSQGLTIVNILLSLEIFIIIQTNLIKQDGNQIIYISLYPSQ